MAKYRCKRCNYTWYSRKHNSKGRAIKPKACPNCKNVNWNKRKLKRKRKKSKRWK